MEFGAQSVRKRTSQSRIVRNLCAYLSITATLSIAGGLVIGQGEPVGGLLFVAGPAVGALLLRTIGKDGFGDSGFGLGKAPFTYLVALLLFPLCFGIIALGGWAAGAVSVTGSLPGLGAAIASAFIPRTVFAAFEEIGWRGYAEPKLAVLGLPALPRHLLIGSYWAIWHIPFILATPNYAPRLDTLFWIQMAAGTLIMAVVHGQLREQSQSVWPSVILHGVGNAVAWPLVYGGFIEVKAEWAAARPGTLPFLAIWVLVAVWLLRRGPGADRTSGERDSGERNSGERNSGVRAPNSGL